VCHRDNGGEQSEGVAVAREDNEEAWSALRTGKANVVGGTSWLWSPEAAFEAVDVLFIDEAGQMSLADVLAVSQAGKKLVLLGDPQQLERPTKGSHPDGAEKSALEHLLDGGRRFRRGWDSYCRRLGGCIRGFADILRNFFMTISCVRMPFHGAACSKARMARWAGLCSCRWSMRGAGTRRPRSRGSDANRRAIAKPNVKWFYSAGHSRGLKEKTF